MKHKFNTGDGVICKDRQEKKELLELAKKHGYPTYYQTEEHYWKSTYTHFFMGNTNMFIGAKEEEITNPIPAEEFKALVTVKPIYKVGDEVEVVSNTSGHNFDIGEVVRVIEVYNKDYYVQAKGEGDSWYLGVKEIKPHKKQNMKYQAKREDLESIINLPVCGEWEARIIRWCKEKPFGDIDLTESQVASMFKAAPTATHSKKLMEILNKMFPNYEKEAYSFKIRDKFVFELYGGEKRTYILASPDSNYSTLFSPDTGQSWNGMVKRKPKNLNIQDFQELCGSENAKEIYKTKH